MAYGAILGQRRGLYPQIVVTRSPAESNVQVTATYNGSTVSVLSVNGVAVLNVYGYGTWIVGAEDKTQNVVVDTVKQYSVNITLARGTPLSSITVGQFVKLNEGGSPVEFYVAKHDYESGLNGAGRTLLVRKDCYGQRQWSNSNNNYNQSSISQWLTGNYKNILDADIKTAISTTTFYYYDPATSTAKTMTASVFLLSTEELGVPISDLGDGSQLPISDTLKTAKYNGSPVAQWTRTPARMYGEQVVVIRSDGTASYWDWSANNYVRPVFTLPGTISVDQDNNIIVP